MRLRGTQSGGSTAQGAWRAWRNVWFPTARSVLLRQDIVRLDLHSFDSVLIVGAGEDPYRHLFGGSRRYVTMDITVYADHTDVVADGQALPFGRDAFDCVFASEVVEHLSDPRAFLFEARRVLVPGGWMVLTVPFMFHMHADPHDFWRLSREGFRRTCEGFSSVEIYAQGNRLHVLSDLVTTAFSPTPWLLPLRALNHVLRLWDFGAELTDSASSAPSGFLVVAKK